MDHSPRIEAEDEDDDDDYKPSKEDLENAENGTQPTRENPSPLPDDKYQYTS